MSTMQCRAIVSIIFANVADREYAMNIRVQDIVTDVIVHADENRS